MGIHRDVEEDFYASDRICDECMDLLHFSDEVFRVEVSAAVLNANGRAEWQPLLLPNGDYSYHPYLLHLECWEEICGDIQDAVADMPPVRGESPCLTCSCCKSTLDEYEPFAAATLSELRRSRRTPSGNTTSVLTDIGQFESVCLRCVLALSGDHFKEWEPLLDDFLTLGKST